MVEPEGLSYNAISSHLFVIDSGNDRVLMFNVGPSVIANGMNAAKLTVFACGLKPLSRRYSAA